MSRNLFRYFKTSPEFIQLGVIMHVRFPLSLRNVEDFLRKRGSDIFHETIRQWAHRFSTCFPYKNRGRRSEVICQVPHRCLHLDELFVKNRSQARYRWRAIDHQLEVLEAYVPKNRGRDAAIRKLW
jgi:putative transposase